MTIPDDVLLKIRYLCRKISRVEWSGILFYTVEGKFTGSPDIKITLKDIFLMDKGTSVYTSFDWTEEIVEYRMNNPESLDWVVGHIHSHNTMGVFFSGTDWEELNDNSPNHNFYLSVIVNNYMDIKAKLAFIGEPKSFMCKNEEGKDFSLKLTKGSVTPTMFVYDVVTDIAAEEIPVPDEFGKRLQHIEDAAKKKEEEEKKAKETKNPVVKEGHQLNLYNKRSSKNDGIGDWEKGINHSSLKKMEQGDDFTMQTIEQEFTTYVLRLGNNADEIDDELTDALEDIEESINNQELVLSSFIDSILNSYGALHERFFEKLPKFQGDEAFLSMLESVITELEIVERDYPFTGDIVSALKALGTKFEQFMKEQQSQKV